MIEKENLSCIICNHKNLQNLHMHGYSYYKCSLCNHIFSNDNEMFCKEKINRVSKSNLIKEKLLIQNYPSTNCDIFFKEDIEIKNHYLELVKNNKEHYNILDCNIIHNNLKSKYGNVNFYGSYINYFFKDFHLNDKNIKENILHINNKFDMILCINYIEYSYCPYDLIILLKSLLKKETLKPSIILSVNIDNNPKTNYLARIHEFSRKSAEIFVEQVSSSYRLLFKHNRVIAEIDS